MIGKATLRYLDKTLESDLKAELRAQGHYLTGELERSINSTLQEIAGGESLEVTAADYIQQLETGVPASQIRATPAYYAAIEKYVELRFGLFGAKAAHVASLIVSKHKAHGMPTAESYAYSDTGHRTEVLEDTYNGHEDYYNQIVGDSLSYELDQAIDQTFTITEF